MRREFTAHRQPDGSAALGITEYGLEVADCEALLAAIRRALAMDWPDNADVTVAELAGGPDSPRYNRPGAYTVRVRIASYRGHTGLDIRCWTAAGEGREPIPTRIGLRMTREAAEAMVERTA